MYVCWLYIGAASTFLDMPILEERRENKLLANIGDGCTWKKIMS